MSRLVEQEAEQTAREQLQRGSLLEQSIGVGVNGPPELRRGERNAFLGQFPEQVLKAARASSIAGKTVPEPLLHALADPRCRHAYLAAPMVSRLGPVLRAIRQLGLRFTIVQSPDHAIDTAVVLTTDQSHDETDIWV